MVWCTSLDIYGRWHLVDAADQVTSLAAFYPSVGIPTALVAHVQWVSVTPRAWCAWKT